jgi:hypothetical protein
MTSIIHTLLGARPPARSDGKPWNRVHIEHSEAEDGPWVEDGVQTLSPVDSDPTSPAKRDLTFSSSLAEGYFRLTFLDADNNESTPTDPVFDDGSGVDWRASSGDVATILRARTQDMGTESGAFSDTTRPTKGQVQVLIGQAVNEIAARLGTDELPSDDLRAYARELVAIRGAMGVELSYFPEQTNTDQSAYEHLRELFEAGLKALIEAIPDTSATKQGMYSIRTRSDVAGSGLLSTAEQLP